MVGNPLLDEQGQVCGVIINSRDISDRKRNEEELRASEETLRVISDTALDALIMMDSVGQVRHWNAAAERMFGYTRDEILGRDLHRLLTPPHSHELYEKARPHFFETGQGASDWKAARTGGRSQGWQSLPRRAFQWPPFNFGASGTRSGSYATSPSAKRVEETLKESENHFRRITTNMIDQIFETDAEGKSGLYHAFDPDRDGIHAGGCAGQARARLRSPG